MLAKNNGQSRYDDGLALASPSPHTPSLSGANLFIIRSSRTPNCLQIVELTPGASPLAKPRTPPGVRGLLLRQAIAGPPRRL